VLSKAQEEMGNTQSSTDASRRPKKQKKKRSNAASHPKMEYVDCVVMGNKGIGKHSLIGNFQSEDQARKDEVSLSLTIDKKRVDFIVKIADGLCAYYVCLFTSLQS
jgi:putative ribosome biogenesis GTPase RsgA